MPADLLATGIIREAESRNVRSGRPPIVLEINPARGYVIGIDFGAIHLNWLAADISARILEEIEVEIDIQDGPQACLAEANFRVKELLAKTHLDLKDVLTIGIGVPGPIVTEAGMVAAPPIMPVWDRYPSRDTLQKLWGCPVSVNNDAELGVLGDWASGAGRGERNLVYIKVDTGIGAGLLMDGQIY